jgi:hypothetical protein
VVHIGTVAVLPEFARCPTFTRDPHAEPLYAVSDCRSAVGAAVGAPVAASATAGIISAQLATVAITVVIRRPGTARRTVEDFARARADRLIGGMVSSPS